MTDLTEQMTDLNKKWYEGKLPKEQYYYAKDSSEGDCIVHIDKSNELTFTGWEVPYKPDQSNILEPFKLRTELLSQVPSYEEWKALNGNMDSVMQTNQALCKKLAELKELLRECKGLMNTTKDWACTEATETLITKIDEMLK